MISSIPMLETRRTPAIPFSPGETNQRQKALLACGFIALVAAGILLRLLVVLLAGGGMRTPWGGGGDTPAYVLLAQNLVNGKGFAYAGEPTALRPPGYPILLAGCIELLHGRALAGMRWLQFFAGLGTAFLCAATAKRIFGPKAAKAVLVVALFFPTLVIMNGEILSEAGATFCSAIFLYFLVRHFVQPHWITLAGLGITAGLGALMRFNMALLGVIVLVACFLIKDGLPKWRSAALAVVLMGLVVSPWLIRNLIAFHGQVLFSTHAGIDAAEGILTPQGRALPGDAERLHEALGWVAPGQVETNDASRRLLPSEPVLNGRAWAAVRQLWGQQSWGLVPLAIRKVSCFWLSTDQLLWTESFEFKDRLARGSAVLVYWGLLALAAVGWLRLRSADPMLARLFLLYAVLVTILHLPFVMNTRLRMSLIDPWTAVLAGAGWAALAARQAGSKRKGIIAAKRCVGAAK
jgi:4-amino-4-deoxy-L-arabinose transferase-like glycosyltransferase